MAQRTHHGPRRRVFSRICPPCFVPTAESPRNNGRSLNPAHHEPHRLCSPRVFPIRKKSIKVRNNIFQSPGRSNARDVPTKYHKRHTTPPRRQHRQIIKKILLRGTISNRTYGTYRKLYLFTIFTKNMWSYLQWSPRKNAPSLEGDGRKNQAVKAH